MHKQMFVVNVLTQNLRIFQATQW